MVGLFRNKASVPWAYLLVFFPLLDVFITGSFTFRATDGSRFIQSYPHIKVDSSNIDVLDRYRYACYKLQKKKRKYGANNGR